MAVTVPRKQGFDGRFGDFGGRYVPETLMTALDELATLYDGVRQDQAFWAEYEGLLTEFVGRPSPLTRAVFGVR